MPPKKVNRGKPIGKSGFSLDDLVEMALKDAVRSERAESYVVVDNAIQHMVMETAKIMKEKELRVKVTPFAQVHTRFTMEALFNFNYTYPDNREDDIYIDGIADEIEPTPAKEDGTNWDIKANDENVKQRFAQKYKRNTEASLNRTVTKIVGTMFSRSNSKMSNSSGSKKTDMIPTPVRSTGQFSGKKRNAGPKGPQSERTKFLSQENLNKTGQRFEKLAEIIKKPSEIEFVGEMAIAEYITQKRDYHSRMVQKKKNDQEREAKNLKLRRGGGSSMSGGKNNVGGGKAYAILQEQNKKGGHATDGPYFVDEEMKIYPNRIAADKLQQEYKKAPKAEVPDETIFIENRDEVLRREKEERIRNELSSSKQKTGISNYIKQKTIFKQADQNLNADTRMNQNSSGTLKSSRGTLASEMPSEDVRPENIATMFVFPGRNTSSTMAMMLATEDSVGSLPNTATNEQNISKATLDSTDRPITKQSKAKKKKTQKKTLTMEQLINSRDVEIPGVRPLKNLNLLQAMEAKTGVAILIPRRPGEKVDDEDDSPQNSATKLDRLSNASGVLDNQRGSGQSIFSSNRKTSNKRNSPGMSDRNSPMTAWGTVPIRYKVLKQGEPYRALASDPTHTLFTKAEYTSMKEGEQELGKQRSPGHFDPHRTNSSIDPWTSVDSRQSNRNRKKMSGLEIKVGGQNDTAQPSSFAFGARNRSVQPIRVSIDGHQTAQSSIFSVKRRSYDTIQQEGVAQGVVYDNPTVSPSNASLAIREQDQSNHNGKTFTSVLPMIKEPGFYTKRNQDHSQTLLQFPGVPGLGQLNNRSGDLTPLLRNTPFVRHKDFDASMASRTPAAIAQRQKAFMHRHGSSTIGEKQDPQEVIQQMRLKIEKKVKTLEDKNKPEGRKQQSSAEQYLTKGWARDLMAPFGQQQPSKTLATVLKQSGLKPSGRNLNTIRSMQRTLNQSPKKPTKTPVYPTIMPMSQHSSKCQ